MTTASSLVTSSPGPETLSPSQHVLRQAPGLRGLILRATCVSATILLAHPPEAVAQSSLLDFEGVVGATGFASVVPETGNGPLLMTHDLTLDGAVILNDVGFAGAATSGHNVYATCDACLLGGSPATALTGRITATFVSPVTRVDVDVINGSPNQGVLILTGFGSEGQILFSDAEVTEQNGVAGHVQHLSIEFPGIMSIEVRADIPPGYSFAIDGLAYGGAGTTFCVGSAARCPCGNAGSQGRGCENSFGTGGGRLMASGAPRVSADTLLLSVDGLPLTAPGLYFQGTAQVSGGVPFGDGLRCVGGKVVTLATKTSTNGVSVYPTESDPPISADGLVPDSGGTRFYQVWYRNSALFCGTGLFNLSSALSIEWEP